MASTQSFGQGFDIDEFQSVIAESGFLKPTKFLFTLTTPLGFRNTSLQPRSAAASVDGMARDLKFWASSATLPGMSMLAHDVRRYGYGAVSKKPFAPGFAPMTLGFVADGMGDTRTFFNKWLSLVNNFDSSQGVTKASSSQGVYEVGYSDDYVVEAVVSAYVDTGDEIMRIALHDAFPLGMSDINLSWGENGQVARFNVSLAYTDWRQEEIS